MKTSQKAGKSSILEQLRGFGDDLWESGTSAVKDSFSDVDGQIFGGKNQDKAKKPNDRFPSQFNDQFGGMDNPFGSGMDPFAGMGKDPFAEFGKMPEFGAQNPFGKQEKKEPVRIRRQEVLFNRQEQGIMQEMRMLLKEVKKELDAVKVQEASLVSDITKLTLNDSNEKPGIYHLRFLEFIIKLLRSIRKKISEGRMWLESSYQRKKQKGFRGKARKHGTAFSLSKEVSQSNLPG